VLALSNVREPTLSIVCEPFGSRGRYRMARLMKRHGDARLTDLLEARQLSESAMPRRSRLPDMDHAESTQRAVISRDTIFDSSLVGRIPARLT
jgi:hypothetical protein